SSYFSSSAYYVCLLLYTHSCSLIFLFFFTHPSPTQIYTLSLHDALPISASSPSPAPVLPAPFFRDVSELIKSSHVEEWFDDFERDRKSTRLNSSHLVISYAVFCLKKKKKKKNNS